MKSLNNISIRYCIGIKDYGEIDEGNKVVYDGVDGLL